MTGVKYLWQYLLITMECSMSRIDSIKNYGATDELLSINLQSESTSAMATITVPHVMATYQFISRAQLIVNNPEASILSLESEQYSCAVEQ